jgi:hypothetical protein
MLSYLGIIQSWHYSIGCIQYASIGFIQYCMLAFWMTSISSTAGIVIELKRSSELNKTGLGQRWR